jgi:phage gp36-like protein
MIAEQTVTETLRLLWPLICEVACYSICNNLTFEQAVQALMVKYLNEVKMENNG